MSEIVKFVHHGASQITPKILKGISSKMPLLKLEFTQLKADKFPHLIQQLEFLADVVEDFAEGADDDLPYVAVAEAAFVLAYVHGHQHLIPDIDHHTATLDESALVRCVLMENEKSFAAFAKRHHLNWGKVTLKA
jgi:hypothetical protein